MGSCGVLFLLVSVPLAVLATHTYLDWVDCGTDPSIVINNLDVKPMPLHIPGPLFLTIDGSLSQDFPADDIEIHLDIKRHAFLLDLPIPCLFHIGSCTYTDSCTSGRVVDTMISENWAGITQDLGRQIKTMLTRIPGLNYTCPVTAGTISLKDYTLTLPEIPSIISFFASGDYKVHINVVDKRTKATKVCLRLGLSVSKG